MNKQSYKELLAEEFSKNSSLENEINRLQILVGKYMDKQREMTKLVYNNNNNFELGKIIREMFRTWCPKHFIEYG